MFIFVHPDNAKWASNGSDYVSRWFKFCSEQGIFKAVNAKAVSSQPTKKPEGKVSLFQLFDYFVLCYFL